MRARDARAIAFCIVTTLLLLAVSWVLLHNYIVSLALTGGYAAWLLTRPRMQRVISRLRGDPDWSGYFSDKAVELYQNEYAIAFPANEWPAGRPAKTTALYEKLKAKGASFCARGGWERAAWFPRKGDDPH